MSDDTVTKLMSTSVWLTDILLYCVYVCSVKCRSFLLHVRTFKYIYMAHSMQIRITDSFSYVCLILGCQHAGFKTINVWHVVYVFSSLPNFLHFNVSLYLSKPERPRIEVRIDEFDF